MFERGLDRRTADQWRHDAVRRLDDRDEQHRCRRRGRRHAEGIALNFGRIMDPTLDGLLESARGTVDRSELDDIGQEINQLFASEVYNLWLNTNEWYNPVASQTRGVNRITLDGRTRTVGQLYGNLFLQEAWLTNA